MPASVPVQHIAGGVGACGGVAHATSLNRNSVIVGGLRGVIAATDDDGQLRLIAQAFGVTGLIGKAVLQQLAGLKGNHVGIAGVEGVAVTAVGVDHQLAVLTGQSDAASAQVSEGTTSGFGPGTGASHDQAVASVYVAVVGQQVTGRVDGVAAAVICGGISKIVAGHGRIIGVMVRVALSVSPAASTTS